MWSDMAIEQTLMSDMKSKGGLTQGRGLSDSVLAKWVGSARTATAMCSSLEVFASVHFMSGEQHVDFCVSRINRDDQDRGKFAQCNINCHKAAEIGSCTMGTYVGTNFADMKQSKKNAVVLLTAMSNIIKVNNEILMVDPMMIFQRTLISTKRDEDVADLLKYELSPYPMTHFDKGCMRKTKMSALYDAFPLCSSSVDLKTSFIVFSPICEQYVSYLINHYAANSAVVFDGYEDVNCTKCAKQKRRGTSKTPAGVNFDENMLATVQQENFLANEKNKTKLIELLVETLTARGIEASTATRDADGSIVKCSLNKVTSHSSVVVIGEDVDLLILLTALTPPDRNVYFMKPGRGNTEDKVYSTRQLQELPFSGFILFIHSFTGCDTTCAIFNKSLIVDREVPGPPSERELNNHRYNSFVKSSTKVKANLASLPPTKGDHGGVLNPIKTTDPIAPDSILNSIFCSCVTGCGGRCGCRKAGIHCSYICGCDGAYMNSTQIQKEDVKADEYFMDFEDMTEL
ncbi:hypothetical protein PR048_003033 [Dryococelus australis]|uniref:Tesmin/TSO1-like CXC domain-containing protein n=1 Tax=Dryococelus australis TaxID=614101 RepID=A0ABQ9IP50_9NEOP|nr:hypothetical protein PR048_003033 [Dryococelus australis]